MLIPIKTALAKKGILQPQELKKSSENNKIAISQSFNKKKNIKKFFLYKHKIPDKKNPNAYTFTYAFESILMKTPSFMNWHF